MYIKNVFQRALRNGESFNCCGREIAKLNYVKQSSILIFKHTGKILEEKPIGSPNYGEQPFKFD